MYFKVFALELSKLSYVGSYFYESLIPLWFGCWAGFALLCHLLISVIGRFNTNNFYFYFLLFSDFILIFFFFSFLFILDDKEVCDTTVT